MFILKLLGCLSLCGLCVYSIHFYFLTNTPSKTQNQVSGYTPSKPRVEIHGLIYDLSYKGKTKFTLNSDKFLVRKKKIGLIRFGLLQEALFENTEITFHTENGIPAHNKNITPKQYIESSQQNKYFFSGFEEDFFSSHAKRLHSLIMTPITIYFYDEDENLSQITASRASLRLKNQDIVFKGNVHLASGAKHITTNQLIFSPNEEEFYIPNKYTLKIRGEEKTGEHLNADIFLRSVSL